MAKATNASHLRAAAIRILSQPQLGAVTHSDWIEVASRIDRDWVVDRHCLHHHIDPANCSEGQCHQQLRIEGESRTARSRWRRRGHDRALHASVEPTIVR